MYSSYIKKNRFNKVTMDLFFSDLFAAFPSYDARWKIYHQKSFKIAIKYKNTTGAMRDMIEIRSGHDGKTELVVDKHSNTHPHQLEPNETRWIAIEPSNKAFKYDASGTFGAAAYPKKPIDTRSQWTALDATEVVDIHQSIKRAGMAIPYYQIADTLANFYPRVLQDRQMLATMLQTELNAGNPNMGFPGKIKIFKSKARVLGHLVAAPKLKFQHRVFPMGYRDVPIERGVLLVIDLESAQPLRLKSGAVKYNAGNGHKVSAPVIARIIDAPAVKGALWTPEAEFDKNKIARLVAKAECILTNPTSFTDV